MLNELRSNPEPFYPVHSLSYQDTTSRSDSFYPDIHTRIAQPAQQNPDKLSILKRSIRVIDENRRRQVQDLESCKEMKGFIRCTELEQDSCKCQERPWKFQSCSSHAQTYELVRNCELPTPPHMFPALYASSHSARHAGLRIVQSRYAVLMFLLAHPMVPKRFEIGNGGVNLVMLEMLLV